MADYNSTVTVTVNGKQAEQVLATLKEKVGRLSASLEQAAEAGDKVTMKKLQREINSTTKLIEQMQSSSRNAAEVMKHLDSASPRELRKTLRTLTAELQNIERGSTAWDEQTKKIRDVQAELTKVNAQLRPEGEGKGSFTGWIRERAAALVALTASMAGVTAAARSAVAAFAELDQAQAGVMKYTGMNAEEVATLNEELKKIDTRSSREQLNELAQQAGRLGKTSQEDVLGFVRAADQINVALDDLGSDATLTLSKLAGIFGDEKRLGTEKALLATGSVINELSQNCAASAPYIAEFASRLGGVGAQAGLTVSQIMAYAAVLDSNNQALEASSTALQQVIVRLFQDPAKYARVAGLDVQQFTALVRTDMNAALIEFLKTLSTAGGMDKLSPMFKEMGENGSRSIATLATLAQHISDVTSQQQVAGEAFREATSITKEFNVQNSTAAAQLEKTRNRLHEASAAIGEQLYPVVAKANAAGATSIELLGHIISLAARHTTALALTAAAVTSYAAAVAIHNTRAAIAAAATRAWSTAITASRALLAPTRLLVVGLYNAVAYLGNGFKVSAAMATRWSTAMRAMNFASWTGLVVAAGTAIAALVLHLRDSYEASARQRKELQDYSRSAANISRSTAEAAAEETSKLQLLYSTATNAALATDTRRAAAAKLQQLYPSYLGNLSTEAIMAGKAAAQYQQLTRHIVAAARARAAEEKMTANAAAQLDLENQQKSMARQMAATQRMLAKERASTTAPITATTSTGAVYTTDTRQHNISVLTKKLDEQRATAAVIAAKIKANEQANANLAKLIAATNGTATGSAATSTEASTIAPPAATTKATATSHSTAPSAAQQWRDKEEAIARVAYSTGETNYQQYTARMAEIAAKFYADQINAKSISETERLQLTAKYNEEQGKLAKALTAQSVEDENTRHNSVMTATKQQYINGELTQKAYQEQSERLEIEHLQALVRIYKNGSKEQQQAQDDLNDALMRQQQRHATETEQQAKRIAGLVDKYFGRSQSIAATEQQLTDLAEAYRQASEAAAAAGKDQAEVDSEYAAAQKSIRQQQGEDTKTDAKRVTEQLAEWLKGDQGQAITQTFSTITSQMGAMFSATTEMIKAELDIQTAAINKRYNDEISLAEGNTYQVSALERRKEHEIAAAKNEANRKQFSMQIVQAIAQTAQNAIAAYGSAAAIPLVGYIIAPIAAGMAIAAGMVQVAAIKKQAKAAEAQGYAEGGFTKPGARLQPAGIVHAGEWVASQTLVNSPATRPLILALDQAQRTGTLPVLAPSRTAQQTTAGSSANAQPQVVVQQDPELRNTLALINRRLSEPLVTINTVTGANGTQQAQEQYNRLIANATPSRTIWK